MTDTPRIYVIGFVGNAVGGFEWDRYRQEVEARAQLIVSENDDRTETRTIQLSDLDLPDDATNEEITDALDARPELWEPAPGVSQ